MNTLIYFFNLRRLFWLRPDPMTLRLLIILGALFCLLIGLGIASHFISKKTKDGLKVKGIRRLSHLGLTMGILGLVYLFFAWQGVALLAARFWLVIWGLSLAVWAFFIVRYLYWQVPKMRREIDNKRKFDKYIP